MAKKEKEMELPPSLVIEFDPPIEWQSGKYDALELHEPCGMDILTAQKVLRGDITAEVIMRYQMSLLAVVSGKPLSVIEKMPISKITVGFKYLQGFIDFGQQTGES